jgi:hypothetical protein
VLNEPPTPAARERPPAVSFLRGLAARSLLLLVAAVSLNLLVDPLGVHGGRLFEPIVLRTRAPKLRLYEQTRPPPAIVILGSSRSFSVEPQYVAARTSRRAFNAAVAGAGVRDYLDFARCMAARDSFPSLLIVAIGVEQAILDARALERDDPMRDCLDPQRAPWERAQAYRGLVTLQETWASLRLLGLEVTGRPAPAYSFGPDGTTRGPGTSRLRLEQAVDDSLAAAWAPSLFDRESLDPQSVAQFRQVLELCREHGAKAIVYLPPYHPRALARYVKESHFASGRARLLEQLASWSREYPLRFYDFTEVGRFGGRDDMFEDASHPTEEANRRMLDTMLADETQGHGHP